MFYAIQHFKNIKKIISLNFKLTFIIKYILGIFQKKIIQISNISQIKKFERIYIEGSYSFNWTTDNAHNFLTIAKVLKKVRKFDQILLEGGGGDNKKKFSKFKDFRDRFF